MLDLITGGRFILGLGAGWHVGEHEAFGIDLPEPKERVDRLESALRVLSALFSDGARKEPGVSLDDLFYPLDRATNEPAPLTPGGPPLWLGGLRPRTLRLVARYAAGWPMPGTHAGNVEYFIEQRDRIRAALEVEGRDPDAFTFAAQVNAGADTHSRREALDASRRLRRAGADHVIIGIPGHAAPAALLDMARDVAEPLLEGAAA
jgi:alkanesulfonate monooxygenase SsuD/methylene tetrahydromethanopterin reductase-like flavin-dependent oxidoreductase (luciferase family)